MRYRIGEEPLDGAVTSASGDFVTLTVWITLFIGIGFVVAGIKGRQRWLAAWGFFSVVACMSYAVAAYLGIFPFG